VRQQRLEGRPAKKQVEKVAGVKTKQGEEKKGKSRDPAAPVIGAGIALVPLLIKKPSRQDLKRRSESKESRFGKGMEKSEPRRRSKQQVAQHIEGPAPQEPKSARVLEKRRQIRTGREECISCKNPFLGNYDGQGE